MCRRREGFTLIELLVVISIISMLAAILFPAFARAKEQARMVQCLANQKQLVEAIQMYVNDNGAYPTMNAGLVNIVGDSGELYCGHATPTTQEQLDYFKSCGIISVIEPYARSKAIWKCPSDSAADPVGTVGRRPCSMHYRFYFAWYGISADHMAPVTETDMYDPSRTFVLSEMWPWHDNRVTGSLSWLSGSTGWCENDKMVFAFCDGHAKAMAVDKVLARSSAWAGQGYDEHWARTPSDKAALADLDE